MLFSHSYPEVRAARSMSQVIDDLANGIPADVSEPVFDQDPERFQSPDLVSDFHTDHFDLREAQQEFVEGYQASSPGEHSPGDPAPPAEPAPSEPVE